MPTQNRQSIYQEIQRLTNERKYRQAESLLHSMQEIDISPSHLISARGLAAIRSGVRECRQAVADMSHRLLEDYRQG